MFVNLCVIVALSFIHASISIFLKKTCFLRNLRMTFADILNTFYMDFGKRNTRSYSFKEPEIEELKSLIPKIENLTEF